MRGHWPLQRASYAAGGVCSRSFAKQQPQQQRRGRQQQQQTAAESSSRRKGQQQGWQKGRRQHLRHTAQPAQRLQARPQATAATCRHTFCFLRSAPSAVTAPKAASQKTVLRLPVEQTLGCHSADPALPLQKTEVQHTLALHSAEGMCPTQQTFGLRRPASCSFRRPVSF